MEEFCCVRGSLLWMKHSCCMEKHATLCFGWISLSAVWITKICVMDGRFWLLRKHSVCSGCHTSISLGSTLWCVLDGPICLLCRYMYSMFWTEELCCVERHMMCYGRDLCGERHCLKELSFAGKERISLYVME